MSAGVSYGSTIMYRNQYWKRYYIQYRLHNDQTFTYKLLRLQKQSKCSCAWFRLKAIGGAQQQGQQAINQGQQLAGQGQAAFGQGQAAIGGAVGQGQAALGGFQSKALIQVNMWMLYILNCSEWYEDMIDHRSYSHNLSSCGLGITARINHISISFSAVQIH